MWPIFFIAPLVFSLGFASPKNRSECCTSALELPWELRCGLNISVPISWWRESCGALVGFDRNCGSFWIQIFGAHIIPIAALAMVLGPGRHPSPLRDAIIGRGKMYIESIINGWAGSWTGFCIEVLAGIIISPIDDVLRLLSAMLMCGPIVCSCLHEVMLNHSVLQYLRGRHKRGESLEIGSIEEIELIIAIFSEDLKTTGLPVHVQEDIEAKLRARPGVADDEIRNSSATRPSSLLAVIISIVYYMLFPLLESNDIPNEGENGFHVTSLAFGIWFLGLGIMVAISEFLASTCYPSLSERYRSHADMNTGTHCGLSQPNPVDQATAYENSWIWEGSTSRMNWLRRTAAWEDSDLRKKLIVVNNWWPLTFVAALLLTTIPSLLAVSIEWTIPEPRAESISRVIISYTCVQLYLICFWARPVDGTTQNNSVLERALPNRLGWLRRRMYGRLVAARFLLLLLVGVYFKNPVDSLCHRDAGCRPTWHSLHTCHSTIALASDSQQERNAKRQQQIAVFATLGFLIFIMWLRWWQQRTLRLRIAKVLESPGQERLDHISLVAVIVSYVLRTASNTCHQLKNIFLRPRLKLGFRRLEWCCVSRLLLDASFANG